MRILRKTVKQERSGTKKKTRLHLMTRDAYHAKRSRQDKQTAAAVIPLVFSSGLMRASPIRDSERRYSGQGAACALVAMSAAMVTSGMTAAAGMAFAESFATAVALGRMAASVGLLRIVSAAAE